MNVWDKFTLQEMIDVSKEIIALLMLASLVLSLVSCQQNVSATQVAAEIPPDKLVTTVVDQPAVAETPLATPSPSLQMTPETPPDELATTTAGQPAVAETLSATPSPLFEENTELAGRWQRLDTAGGGEQTAIAGHPTNPDLV